MNGKLNKWIYLFRWKDGWIDYMDRFVLNFHTIKY